MTTPQIIGIVLNLLLIPILSVIWSVQGRISNIEGKLDVMLERREEKR